MENALTREGRRRPASQAVTYLYHAQGTLIKRTNADGSWTAYVGGIYEVTKTGVVTKYYAAYGRAIALRKAGTPSYLLSDHLGSATAITDTTGAVVSTQKYWPYGTPRLQTGTLATDKQFTGQQGEPGDSALGLYNYKARFYSAVLGRFVSADTIVPEVSQRGLNRYAYNVNNPMRYVDPSGHCFTWLGTEQPCAAADAKSWLTCGIVQGACSGDLRRMARWALGLREFRNNIEGLLSDAFWRGDDTLRKDILTIRSPLGVGGHLDPLLVFGGTGAEAGGPLGVRQGYRAAFAKINWIESDYSYLDVRLAVYGRFNKVVGSVGLRMTVSDSGRPNQSVTSEGVAMGGTTDDQEGENRAWGFRIIASVFDPDRTSLRVTFDLAPSGLANDELSYGTSATVGDLIEYLNIPR